MYCGPLPQTDQEPTLFERLEKHPEEISDEDLKLLMNHSGGRGKNARIPFMACNEYERRHSPTEAK